MLYKNEVNILENQRGGQCANYSRLGGNQGLNIGGKGG